MKKEIFVLLLLFLSCVAVFAEESNETTLNDSISGENESLGSTVQEENLSAFEENNSIENGEVIEEVSESNDLISTSENQEEISSQQPEIKETTESSFKINKETTTIGLILGVVALLIIIFFVLSFLRRPKQ